MSTPGTVDQGQTSVLSNSTVVSTGTNLDTFQWFVMTPGAGSYSSISGATSSSYSFVTSTSTATGSWSFILQVTDSAGAAVNYTAASVAVDSTLVAPIRGAFYWHDCSRSDFHFDFHGCIDWY